MSRRFFDHDPATNATEFFHYDESTGDFAIETVSDVGPILEANKRQWNDGDGYTPSREMRKIASIPLVILEKWKNELGIDWNNKNHAPAIRRLLNDPDWRYLRTAPGCF